MNAAAKGELTDRCLRMIALVESFPTIRRTSLDHQLDEYGDWDAVRFAKSWLCGSGGEKDAALFVLSVWNPETDWEDTAGLTRGGERGGFFNVHQALGNWDDGHRAAFLAWARKPWWP